MHKGEKYGSHVEDLIIKNENYWKNIQEIKFGKKSEFREREKKKLHFQEKKVLEEYQAVKKGRQV